MASNHTAQNSAQFRHGKVARGTRREAASSQCGSDVMCGDGTRANSDPASRSRRDPNCWLPIQVRRTEQWPTHTHTEAHLPTHIHPHSSTPTFRPIFSKRAIHSRPVLSCHTDRDKACARDRTRKGVCLCVQGRERERHRERNFSDVGATSSNAVSGLSRFT